MTITPSQNSVQALWPCQAPGGPGSAESDVPAVIVYLPDPASATGTGIVICGGGGYDRVEFDKESIPAAQFFNQMGVAAFVLRYRLTPTYRYPVMMWDVQRAIRYVRSNAANYGLKVDQIGIMCFSAGGHLASSASVHSANSFGVPQTDAIDQVSARPDMQILIYPVIMMTGDFAAKQSRQHLLGADPDPKPAQYLSNEQHVTPNTPPSFLVSTFEDTIAPLRE
jgi:acetyl esterase/lipase